MLIESCHSPVTVYSVCGTIDGALQTRDYFDATASNWNTSAQSRPLASLYKDGQSNRRVGVF